MEFKRLYATCFTVFMSAVFALGDDFIVHPALELGFKTVPGMHYQFEYSGDLDSWIVTEELFGNGLSEQRYQSLPGVLSKRFFRLNPTPGVSNVPCHVDLPNPNSVFLEDFNGVGTHSFLQLANGMSYSNNSGGVAMFPWDGVENDPSVIFNQLFGTYDFLAFSRLRMRHRFTSANANSIAWANPAAAGQHVIVPVRSSMTTQASNTPFSAPGNGTGLRIDPVPGTATHVAATWEVDYVALDRGRTLGWEFDAEGTARGGVDHPVTANHFVGITSGTYVEGANGGAVSGGVFSATTATSDPELIFDLTPAFGLPNHLDSSIYTFVEIRIRVTGGVPGQFFFSNGSGGFAVNQPVFDILTDGDFHTYLLDLSGNAAWVHSNITSFRLDPCTAEGVKVEVDYLRFCETTAIPRTTEENLWLQSAAELEFVTSSGQTYFLQSSFEEELWVTEEQLAGTGSSEFRFRSVGEGHPSSYRLVVQGDPPAVSTPLPAQVVTAGVPFTLAIPASNFTDPEGMPLLFKAGIEGGYLLPIWMSFNPQAMELTGTAPGFAPGDYAIEITADDQIDGTGSSVFVLSVSPPLLDEPFAELWTTQLSSDTTSTESWALGDPTNLTQWSNLRGKLKVIKLYIGLLRTATDEQLQDFAAIANQNEIKVSIEMGGLAPGSPTTSGDVQNAGELSFEAEFADIERFLNQGGNVHYLEFDDPVGRAFYPKVGASSVETGFFTATTAIREIIDAMERYRSAMPGLQFIYLTNFPNWGWEGSPAYQNLGLTPGALGRGDLKPILEEMILTAIDRGIPLFGVCADHPFGYYSGTHLSNQPEQTVTVDWKQRVLDLEQFAEERGLSFLLITNDEAGGHTSDLAFQQGVFDYLEDYKLVGGSAFAYHIQSWYPYPQFALPETTSGRMAYIVNEAYNRF